ncbi:hypothetical protein FSP39_024252 [Pinctada imbricata]|uniref:Uncharacterized protein n=1 Tax=Pinctada imbricata TaxID=66713 RepID=A0AA88YFN3_PINIB|nr:hypothetical protein FSP39_024252 [Pinctada imbricata]
MLTQLVIRSVGITSLSSCAEHKFPNFSVVEVRKVNYLGIDLKVRPVKPNLQSSLWSASPDNGFMILNRLGLNNLIEPITKDLEFQLQDPFLLYRNAKVIHGIWFYDKDECARIGQLMNSLLQLALEHYRENRQRRVSESDSVQEKTEMVSAGVKNVDILQMLSKAQDEYDKAKSGVPPKPFIDNPNASAMKSSEIHRPKPLKASNDDDGRYSNDDDDTTDQDSNQNASSSAAAAPISLETLFRNASLQQQKQQGEKPEVKKGPGFHRSVSVSEGESKFQREESPNELPALLRHLMSTGSTVEEIEKQQRGEILSRNQQRRSPNSTSGRAASKFYLPSEEETNTTGQKFYRQHSLQPVSRRNKSPKLSSNVILDDINVAKGGNVSMETIQTNILSRGESQKIQDLLTQKSPIFPVAQQQSNRRTSQSSLSSAKSGSDLLTPAALEHSLASQSSVTSDLPERPASCSKILGSEVLLTPMAFIQGSQSPTITGILHGAVGTYYYNPSVSKSTYSSEYTATVAGIVLGGLVGLVLLIVIIIVIVHICCKGKHHRDRRRLVAPRDGPFTLGLGPEGSHRFTTQPVPPPAYDSLYPCPTEGNQTSREPPTYSRQGNHTSREHPTSPPPPYSERLTMHI